MDKNPYESPQQFNHRQLASRPPGGVVGGLVFVVTLILGVILTRQYVDRFVQYIPVEEVYEAIQRDAVAIETTLIGWFVSFMIAISLAEGSGILVEFLKSKATDIQSEIAP